METPPTPERPSGDLQDLIRLTEWEVKRMEDAKREQGWSPWMLFVALAGLMWKSVDELGQPHVWTHVALYWAALTLMANFGTDVLRVLMARPRDRKGGAAPRYFSANKLLGGTRPYLIFVALKVSGAAALVLLSHALVGWQLWVWVVMFGLHFAGWLTTLTLSFFDLPLTPSTERWRSSLMTGVGIAYAFHATAMFSMCWELRPILLVDLSVSDLKLALMLFAGTEIVSLLLSHHIVNPIRDNLVQLRRAMGLGEMGYDDGRARLDLTLHGAEISRYLQPRVQEFLTILNEVTVELDSLRQIGAAFEHGRDETKEAGAFADRAKASRKAIRRLLSQAEEAAEAFNLRVGVVSASDFRIKEEVHQLRKSMGEQVSAVKERFERLEKESARLLELNEVTKNASDHDQPRPLPEHQVI